MYWIFLKKIKDLFWKKICPHSEPVLWTHGIDFCCQQSSQQPGRRGNKGPALPSPAVRAPDTHKAASEGLYWEISADKACRSSSSATGPPASWEEASPSRAPSDISQSRANFFQVQSCSWPPPGVWAAPQRGARQSRGTTGAPSQRGQEVTVSVSF